MLGRIFLSAATVFGAWCALQISGLAENAIVKEVLSRNLIQTDIPFVCVVAFFIVYRITFLITHKRRCCS